MKQSSLKFKIYGLLIVYLLAWFGQSLMPFLQSDIFANEKKATTNIIALLIDKNLYNNDLKTSVDRYATTYIQQKISNSKAIIFPINTDNIKARDIAKMIENIYYDGIEKTPTTLQGIILIGDKIPLPVVNDKGAIFPTILPYTDFDDPKYYRDPESQFFVPNNVPKAQAELWQSMINIGSQQSDYVAFFEKLKQYHNDPTAYIGNKVWYDDFIDQQASFNKTNLPNYINKFLFAEDLAYHRYNPLLIDLRNKKNNQKTAELTQNLAILTGESGSYANQVGVVFSGLLADYNNTNSGGSDKNTTPTVFVDDALQGFQKSYQDLYGVTSIARMRDNVLSAGRRTTTEIDSHATKIEYYDQLFTKTLGEAKVPLLVEINKKLEDKVISIVQQKEYPLRISIPVSGEIQRHNYTYLRSGGSSIISNNINTFIGQFGASDPYHHEGIYEAFYYGKNANSITGIDQTSIFLGTPNPIDNNIANIGNITGINTTRSVGASYGILSQFVEANRGYVAEKNIIEQDLAQLNGGVCNNNTNNFRALYRGGNTPLNLTGTTELELPNKRYDRTGISSRLLGNIGVIGPSFQAGSLFNIAGSKRVKTIEPWMFVQNLQGGFFQKIAYEVFSFGGSRLQIRQKTNTCNTYDSNAEPLDVYNIYNSTGTLQTGYLKAITLNQQPLLTGAIPCPSNPITGSVCYPFVDLPSIPGGEYIQKQLLHYKTIDSLSIHNAPNPTQINGLLNTTADRPIDSERYLSFRGIGGDQVQFEFPNLYDIPVYKTDINNSGSLILKTPNEIKQSIRTYLQDIVTTYNNTINNQITQKDNYFNSNSGLFLLLGTIDPLATPDRNYTLIDNNILNTILDDEIVETIAQVLYMENSILPKKTPVNNLQEELTQLENISNITNKRKNILENYITKQTPSTPLSLPGYQTKGYELISITSNGDDSVGGIQEPSDIRMVNKQIAAYNDYQKTISNINYGSEEQEQLKEACASQYGEPVPLVNLGDMSFPRFDMFDCWLKRIGKPKVTFDFKNAQGPVLTDSFFKDFVSDTATNQYNISNTVSTATSPEEKAILDAITINVSAQSYLLDSSTPAALQPQISIEKKNNIGNISLTLTSTGTNCAIIDNKNLCTQSYSTILGSNPIILPIGLQTKKSGYSDITAKACSVNSSVCAIQNYLIQIVPGPVANITITTPYDSILEGSPLPIILQGKDEYNNNIPFSFIPYTLSTTTGSLQGQNFKVISDFREIQELQGPISNGIINNTIRISDKNNQTIQEKNISFAPGKVQLLKEDDYFSETTNTITYTLPKKKSLVYINKDYTNISLLPKLGLKLTNNINGQSLAGPVIIQSEQGMFTIHRINSLDNDIVPNTGLETTNTIIFNGATEYIVLKPTGKSNTDNLIITYPNGQKDTIAVNILASNEASSVEITTQDNISTTILPNNSTINAKLYAFDDRGNSVTTPTLIKSNAYGSLEFSGSNSKTTLIPAEGSTSLTVTTSENGGIGYIVSNIVSNTTTTPGLLKTRVEQSIVPKQNINGLYLNLMGTDRGNIYQTQYSNYNVIPKIFQTSEKLLVSTTQLTDPNKIKYSILQISANGDLGGIQANDRILRKRNNSIIIQNTITQKEVIVGELNVLNGGNTIEEALLTYPIDNSIMIAKGRSAGSTNSDKIIMAIDTETVYKPNTIQSIETSINPDKNIGWRSTQEHLTQFGQGKSVGEATMLNSSEFLINYGDPLITRIDQNTLLSGANLDDGPGQSIVNEPSRTVLKALSIDINNDGLKDIVTVFSNGDVIWSKQYGGKEPFVEMGPLLKIFGTIKDVFGVNAQGDGFDDIMIQGEDNTLRIYTNKLGVFDVDGFPVCVNTQNPQSNSLDEIDQRFVEDMDNDDLSDIIINQEGQIKIIYGGVVGNGYTYISQLHDSCDQNRQSRQNNSTKTLETLSTQIAEGNTVDSSLLRRQGLVQTPDSISSDGNVEDTTIDSNLENQIETSLTGSSGVNFGQFPLQEIINQASMNLSRWSVSPIDYLPTYESTTTTQDNIRYITTSQLTTQDQVRVYKKYQDSNGGILKKNDIVKVTVSILGLRNDPMTYIDRIQGPWIVKMSNNGIISGWDNGTLPSTASYQPISPQGGFMFAVDNITLGSANSVEFSYTLIYQGGASTKIKISDRNNDEYNDIGIYPLDGCSRFLRTFTNNKSLLNSYRNYDKEFIDLEDKLNAYDATTQQNSQNYINGMTNAIQNIATATGSDAQAIQNVFNTIGSEQMSIGNLLENSTQQGGTSINLNIQGLGEFDQEVSNAITQGLEQICNGGGEQSCSSGLPTPFNMSFLTPGEFNIMGCKPKISQIDNVFPKDSGFPIFSFPATLNSSVGPLPLPFPFGGLSKGATDSYGYFGIPLDGGTYPSQIRIYMSPTLTQQMGMAICMGPQTAGSNLKAPFNALGGNCIVTAVNMPNSSCANNNPEGGTGSLSDQNLLDLSELGTCTQSKSIQTNNLGEALPSSPFKLVSYNNNTLGNPFPPGTYLGVINFEKTPIVLGEDTNNEGITLQGGEDIQPKVQGGNKKSKGLVACIVNDRLDRQTNYIINNFTNMQIGVYLPDISQIGEGFDNLGEQLNTVENNTGTINNFFQNFGSSGDGINNNIDTFTGNLMQSIRNSTINQSSLQQLSNGINNPFDELAKMFEQTPLVRINTVDVQVNIPMIYAEDIAKYESYLKTWIERNNDIITDWRTIVQGVLGICSRDYSLNSITTPNTNSSLLTKEIVQAEYQKLKDRQNILLGKIEKMKLCEESNRSPTNSACISLMQTQGLNITNIKTVKESLLAQQNITNQCMGLVFDVNGDINGTFKNLFSIINTSTTLENNVRANIKTLDQYKRFPLQLYQWIHVIDRYLSEITTTVDNFLGSLTLWLNTNATRFEQYVDAIITISSALQTRQAILDLSADRQKKCSTCTVDNYDAYACSLGSLCGQLKLPVLKLPPFKIPNIYIDLSHIDIGMDINLPKFQFTPTAVPLIELPNLPQPPNIVINGDIANIDLKKISFLLDKLDIGIGAQIPLSLPTIPLLPSPPTLPELPSFIPNITIELPVLPPAPKIPQIAPEIETVINAVSFFSELYCIVKGGIGLVGESNVKTRIEQLTQRTNSIPLFDNIDLSKDMSYQQDKLEGFDFQIDAYVNFTMNFDNIYTLIAELAESINKQTKRLTEREGDSKEALSTINKQAQELNDTTQQNITIGNPLGFITKTKENSISQEQKNIKEVAQFLINDSRTPEDKKQEILGLTQRLDTSTTVTPQTSAIKQLHNDINISIQQSRSSLSILHHQIKNYDNFIDTLPTSSYREVALYSGKTAFDIQLLSGQDDRIHTNKQNLMKDYIGLQKTLLSHYEKGIHQVTNTSNKDVVKKINKDIQYLKKGLSLSEQIYNANNTSMRELTLLQREYNAEQNMLYNNQAATCNSLGNLSVTSSDSIAQYNVTNIYPYFGATAQLGGASSATTTTSSSTSNLYDFSSYKNKLMIQFPTTSGSQYINVVRSEYFSTNNKGYEHIDINNDNQKDVLRRDNKNVWIKYGVQNSSQFLPIHTTTTSRYIAPTRDTNNQREEESTDGYISINEIKIKVYNKDRSVKNLRVRAQDYDSFTISWTNSIRQQAVEGYLLEINTVPDLYHLKGHNDVPNTMKSRYVLFLPKGSNTNDGYLSIKNQLQTKSFDDLLTGTLLDIVEYNTESTTINYSFTEIPKARYYTRVASLSIQGDDEIPIYSPSSAWSHHIVAGQQIIADEQGPSPDVQLKRILTNTITDTGLSPQGLVNTRYNMLINRTDPNGVIENRIENETGQIISQLSGSSNILSGLYFTQNTINNYRIVARDYNNNVTREQLNLTINIPTISIDDIIYENTPTNGINILSSITQGMDEGIIKFERKRNNVWSLLSNPNSNEGFSYPLALDQTNVLGGLYNQSEQVSFFASNGTVIATMNKENGAISIAPEYNNRITKKVDLTSNTPIVILYDNVDKRNIFTIKQDTKEPQLTALYPYKVINLSGSLYGSFAGGTCITGPENDCIVITSLNGLIIIPSPYHTSLVGTYQYSNNNTIITFSNPTGQPVGSASFKAFIK